MLFRALSIVNILLIKNAFRDKFQSLYIYIYIYTGLVGRVFTHSLRDCGLIPGRVKRKLKKRYIIPPCITLSFIRYVSRVKWSNPGNGVAPSPGVAAIEKGFFGSPSTTVTNFTFINISVTNVGYQY